MIDGCSYFLTCLREAYERSTAENPCTIIRTGLKGEYAQNQKLKDSVDKDIFSMIEKIASESELPLPWRGPINQPFVPGVGMYFENCNYDVGHKFKSKLEDSLQKKYPKEDIRFLMITVTSETSKPLLYDLLGLCGPV